MVFVKFVVKFVQIRGIFKRIQKLDVFWKKVIVAGIVILLGIPLGFLISKNFQNRVQDFEKEEFLRELNLSEIKGGVKKMPLEEIKETKKELEEELKKIEEMTEQVSTSTTSTEE